MTFNIVTHGERDLLKIAYLWNKDEGSVFLTIHQVFFLYFRANFKYLLRKKLVEFQKKFPVNHLFLRHYSVYFILCDKHSFPNQCIYYRKIKEFRIQIKISNDRLYIKIIYLVSSLKRFKKNKTQITLNVGRTWLPFRFG